MIDIVISEKYHYILNKLNLLSTNPILAKEWHPTKNGSLTPNDVTTGSNKKVWWQCKKDNTHEWATTVNNRTHGYGCPYCTNRTVNLQNCLATTHPNLAKEWHPTQNDPLTPNDVTYGSIKKIWWVCNKNNTHEWKVSVNTRTCGRGCPICAGKIVNSKNCLAIINPNLAKEWHPTKNGLLTSNDVTSGSNKKVWWLCKKDNIHEWKAAVKSRSRGSGCPICAGKIINPQNRLLAIRPEIAAEWHPTKNGSLTSSDVTSGSNKKIWWLCKKDNTHEWKTTVYERTSGSGCPYCSNKAVNIQNCLATINPSLAKEWHPIKNGFLTPNDVTSGSNKKIWWLCKKDNTHEWKTSVCDRNKGKGCPFCHSSTSQPELRIYSEIKTIFRKVEHRKKINKIECDIYLPEFGVAIEVDGKRWHKEKIESDKRKNIELEKQGIALIRVRDKGLQRISKFDVVQTLESSSFKLIKAILNSIVRLNNLDNSTGNRIKEYIRGGTFQGESEFTKLLNMLPSALPGTSLFELMPKLAEEWHPTKNGLLTPKDVNPNSHKRIWWLCKKNSAHEWIATANSRTNSERGCPHCAGKIINSQNCLATINPSLAREWHSTKNGLLSPKDIFPNSSKRVWWVCKKDNSHEWKTAVSWRNHGNGCPICAGKIANSQNCLATINPGLAKEWHTTKNGTLTPYDVTPGSHKKVWWICNKNKTHIWEAVVDSRTLGRGCPVCAGKIVSSKNCLATINPKLAKEWHPTKNGSLTPHNVSFGSGEKYWWLCENNKSHEWEATVNRRTWGGACPYCAVHTVNPKNCLVTINSSLASEWHPSKNNTLTPNDVTPNSNKKVWWLCKKDNTHEWETSVKSRSRGSGCPYCYQIER